MRTQENLDFFFGNLLQLMTEAGMSKRQLSLAIGENDGYISDILADRTSPNLETLYAISSALNVDVADLLRPGPKFGVTSADRGNYWVERTAEEFLASALSKSRDAASHEAPTFDAVLNWWHANDGLLTALDSIAQYIDIYEAPDELEMRPRPYKMGRESLSSRELGLSGPEHMMKLFDGSSPDVVRAVAISHRDVCGGQPNFSVHTILFNLSSGNVVELIYNRLLLPCKDGNDHKYVVNYSKPVRRSEIGKEQLHEYEPRQERKAVFSRLS